MQSQEWNSPSCTEDNTVSYGRSWSAQVPSKPYSMAKVPKGSNFASTLMAHIYSSDPSSIAVWSAKLLLTSKGAWPDFEAKPNSTSNVYSQNAPTGYVSLEIFQSETFQNQTEVAFLRESKSHILYKAQEPTSHGQCNCLHKKLQVWLRPWGPLSTSQPDLQGVQLAWGSRWELSAPDQTLE